MNTRNDEVTLRAATPDDEPFLVRLYQSSRGDDLRGLGWEEPRIEEFLAMQYEAQRALDQNEHGQATNEIILKSGEPAGRLLIDVNQSEIRCVDLALLPEYRNRGLGAMVMRRLQDQAAASHRPLRLQVIRFNPAVRLFQRLGFERTSETGTHFQMEWRGVLDELR